MNRTEEHMPPNRQKPFTIAHLSDLHISIDHQRQNIRKTRKLLEHILRLDVDHIVVTGDITADAHPKEFDLARKIFKSYGLLDPAKLSIVPGNHDVFGGVHTAEEIFSFPKRCKQQDFTRMLEKFVELFHETFAKTISDDPAKSFPFGKILGDILLVGMNSVAKYSRVGNPVGSNGEVSDGQFKKVRDLLSADLFKKKRKIVLIHHHFSKLQRDRIGAIHNVWTAIEKRTMKLHGKRRLLELFAREKVDLVLHGHVHENREYERGGIRFLNAGGSVLTGVKSRSHVTLVKVTSADIETTVQQIDTDAGTRVIGSPVLEFDVAA